MNKQNPPTEHSEVNHMEPDSQYLIASEKLPFQVFFEILLPLFWNLLKMKV